MPKEQIKQQKITAFNFMVEVLQEEGKSKQFIVRVQSPTGLGVACMGTIKEFNQFIESL